MFITSLPYLCKKWEVSYVSFCASDQLVGNNTRYAFKRIVHCKIIRFIFARFSRMNHSDIFFSSSFPFLNRTNGTRTNRYRLWTLYPRYWHTLFTMQRIPRRSSVCLREPRARSRVEFDLRESASTGRSPLDLIVSFFATVLLSRSSVPAYHT